MSNICLEIVQTALDETIDTLLWGTVKSIAYVQNTVHCLGAKTVLPRRRVQMLGAGYSTLLRLGAEYSTLHYIGE